jgi:hypothetical protein
VFHGKAVKRKWVCSITVSYSKHTLADCADTMVLDARCRAIVLLKLTSIPTVTIDLLVRWVSLLCTQILTGGFLSIHISCFDLAVGWIFRIGASQRLTVLRIDGPRICDKSLPRSSVNLFIPSLDGRGSSTYTAQGYPCLASFMVGEAI